MSAVEWGQESPYNKYVTINCNGSNDNCVKGEKANATGCVAVAVSELLAYWKYPKVIDGTTFNWDNIVKYTGNYGRNNYFNYQWKGSISSNYIIADNVATLMQKVGVGVNMLYHKDKASSTIGDAYSYLLSLGYTSSDGMQAYSFEKTKKSLDNKCIVLMRGSRIDDEGERHGHMWTIDGYLQQKQEVITELKPLDSFPKRICAHHV